MDIRSFLDKQIEWSTRTFGAPHERAHGVVDHIRKELVEIEADPFNVHEWVDVIILAFDGAWRTGASVNHILSALQAKQDENALRVWPDWRAAEPGKAIEHVRAVEVIEGEEAGG